MQTFLGIAKLSEKRSTKTVGKGIEQWCFGFIETGVANVQKR